MRVREAFNSGRVLVCFWLLNFALAQTLKEWLNDPESPLLSSEHLEAYVPSPENPESTYAYDRFSLIDALNQIIRGNGPVVHTRKKYISETDLLELTDDKYKIGLAYFWALGGIERDLKLAFKNFEQAAANGDADAMFMVGLAYSTGFLGDQGPKPDAAKATLYYTLAAEQGSLEAQVAMGHRKRFGIDTVVDLDSALYYYSKAGDSLLDSLEEFHENEKWYYDRVNKHVFAFGAELNTGLYGKHVYRKHIASDVRTSVPLGDQSAAWRFISIGYRNEFEDLDDAIETLFYRATEEFDAAAMYALARVYAAGIDGKGPNWKMAIRYGRRCLEQGSFSAKRVLDFTRQDKIQSLCAEFMGERYLHGNEGVKQNITQARKLYKFAESKTEDRAHPWQKCSTCAGGLALCDWVEAKQNGTLPALDGTEFTVASNETTTAFINKFKKALAKSEVTTDYTIPVLLAKMYLAIGSPEARLDAKGTLQKTIADTSGNVPVASLILAQLEVGDERRLNRYIQGVEAVDELFCPLEFAHRSYDIGDIESAFLAFMISSELGITSASLNLADLLDVRHSMIGSKYGHRWPRLRAVSEWPVPSFVTDRTTKAARYFALAAMHGSVDALSKVVEYGWYYGLIPEKLNQWYLEALIASNFGMAQWSQGYIDYANQKYAQAMDRLTRALVNPEAWLPVKFSQFLTAVQLLRQDWKCETRDKCTMWAKFKAAYKSMATFEPNLRKDHVDPFNDESIFLKAAGLERSSRVNSGGEDFHENVTSNISLMQRIFSTSTTAIIIAILSVIATRIWMQQRNGRA